MVEPELSRPVHFTTREAAEYLGLAWRTLERWRADGVGPAYLKLGGAVRYDRADLDRFITGCRQIPERLLTA